MTGSSSTTKILRVVIGWFIILAHFYRGIDAWEIETEDRPFAGGALFKPEYAVHSLDVAATNVEAQAGPACHGCQRMRAALALSKSSRLTSASTTSTFSTTPSPTQL